MPNLSRNFGCHVLGLLIGCGAPLYGVLLGLYFFNFGSASGSADGRFGGKTFCSSYSWYGVLVWWNCEYLDDKSLCSASNSINTVVSPIENCLLCLRITQRMDAFVDLEKLSQAFLE